MRYDAPRRSVAAVQEQLVSKLDDRSGVGQKGCVGGKQIANTEVVDRRVRQEITRVEKGALAAA